GAAPAGDGGGPAMPCSGREPARFAPLIRAARASRAGGRSTAAGPPAWAAAGPSRSVTARGLRDRPTVAAVTRSSKDAVITSRSDVQTGSQRYRPVVVPDR